MLSMHTSPLEQPGTGDAGGLNVYVVELSRQLAALGTEVEVFTRATSSSLPPTAELHPGVTVRHVPAGPFEEMQRAELPAWMCAFTADVLRAEAEREPGWFDLVHSHYWLSGQVGLAAARRWGAPLVHTAHTLAKVKNRTLAVGDPPEPPARVLGEEEVVAASTRLVASTAEEARHLVDLYGADPTAVDVVAPGVDLEMFRPGEQAAARRRIGVPVNGHLLLFVGRIQPLKAPDLLLHATAELLRRDPRLRESLTVAVVGGPSGTGLDRPDALVKLAADLGISDVVLFHPPAPRAQLADWFRAATAVVVPSHSESFGLVAIEAQACGTPVVAAAVGGLRIAVADGRSGILIAGRDPVAYADALSELLARPGWRRRLAAGARAHAAGFGWPATAHGVLASYRAALSPSAVAV
ncbi:D-inositol-3-phosphate glycosyltransferase [Frankia sp. CNm7]|uniref:D-inositol-3-phosphate glycosyltransferase n=1 Tax=Frankia nepalensis TaxID=1836974 RepID=A0A937UQ63_9ACTN|nr:D-inositol-3-phosphate glycosyltransferase [Frankia nepalensis]MBL7497686.1 D-inositol-3-phosphate glycosyltransferase [Frankia nepalensis]MBL7514727.1 D-inositol-3-phosphate glycosyltransferase [Frankia nepalensis]MBL7520923.1 D-inositol-3-phosphate glycosyltransferase [Frankia nepalensis]MBL7626326.1 D-inositol-3-phosphate glycosyltransferase [Frankia nepalensis]